MTPSNPPQRGPSPLVAGLLIALLCVVWGSTWIVIAGGLDDLPPLTSAAARFVVAGLAMCAVVAGAGRRESGARAPAWLWIVLGVLNFTASYAIVYTTETVLPSGLTSLLWGVFPLMMALAAHLYLPGERLRGAQWLGFLVGLAGLVLLFFTRLREYGAVGTSAALILLLSPLVSAVGSTLVKRHGAGFNSLALNRNAMLLGALLLSALAFVFERDAEANWTRAAIGSVLYLALAGTVLTFGLYFWLLRYVSAHRMSLIAYVTPALALTLGSLVRDEPFTLSMAGGAVCVLLGVALVVRGHR